ncbi:MAG: double-strand break repair helicase AddA [Micavibrio sp.]|nr:MAG: double-strand break repair helicase AddA [Micavibrio sp.]
MATPKKNTAAKRTRKPDPNVVQRRASDPEKSVWVTASAGTGKTKVLTDRVLRLMLDGAQPENILCVTFTNAGASVMKNRIREELEKWATCSDAVLNTRLKKLTGKSPDLETRQRARRLFAEYLDTPGGMKIQTIHSFCQSLLKRFPVETGIPPYFDVLDEQSARDLLRQSQADILQQVQDDPDTDLAEAVRRITPEVSEEDFMALIGEITYRRGELLNVLQKHDDGSGTINGAIEAVYQQLGAKRGNTGTDIRRAICQDKGLNGNTPDLSALYEACDILETGSDTDKERGATIRAWLDSDAQDRLEMFDDYLKAFLTEAGEPRKRMTTKATAAALPALEKETQRLLDGLEDMRTVNVARGTESLLVLSNAILDNYKERKRAINALDYDDLIYRTLLFLEEKDGAAWALQKLEGNLEHVLVDEAQDTNPDQWSIIAAITKEFFNPENGKKPNTKSRTMFVVGDEKQSIFSFQRADPQEFKRRRAFFAEQVEKSGGKWQHVQMEVTFRSSPAIISAVDAVFKNDAAADGLSFEDKGKDITHKPFRMGQSGVVELHPVFESRGMKPLPPWPLPTEKEDHYDPSVDMAEHIADQIGDWLKKGEKLKARGRAITPSDIMILVRRRSRFVDDMIRALKKRDIPVSGADRITLRDQIAVMDMLAVGEFALFPRDDYKLATVLKSPLIGLNDKELEELALGREGSLWNALKDKAESGSKKHKDVVDYLETRMTEATARRPYDFFADMLMHPCPGDEHSGLYALYSRLGFEAEDAIVEFMNTLERFEKMNTPALQGLISWINAGDSEIKREIDGDSSNPKIRIMTVHGAKGLEAPIVIMPDTTAVPASNAKTRPKLLWPKGERSVPLWVPRAELENKYFQDEREKIEQERDQEYRRLLYVAMTRAEDRLMVYGYQNSKNRKEDCWYELVKKGLEENLGKDVVYEEAENGDIIRFTAPQTARPKDDGVRPPKKRRKSGVPQWARAQAPAPVPPIKKFTPSMAFRQVKQVANDNKLKDAGLEKKPKTAPSPLDGLEETRDQTIGNIVHQLLEVLPQIPKDQQMEAAKNYIEKPAWNLPKNEQKRIYGQIDRIINDPEFGIMFGPNSRPEVSISGKITQNGEEKLLSGTIDRLVVGEKTVWIVDYKNSKYIPKTADKISPQYVLQLAAYREAVKDIYPDKEVKCALLWTRKALLQPVPDTMLDQACAKAGIAPKTAQQKPAPQKPKSKQPRRRNPKP